jgi:hypothetical protein
VAGTLLLAGFASLNLAGPISQAQAQGRGGFYGSRMLVPSGTQFNVQLDSKISTEHAQQGDYWTGTVTQSVLRNSRVVIPAGSQVEGTVTRTSQGQHNSKAQLGLAVHRAVLDGQTYDLNAQTQPIVAGTKRAKKLGAIVGGAAVGALLGNIVGGGKTGTVVGGVVGGAAGYGLTRNGMRTLVLKEGTVVTFTTRGNMLARR